MSLFSSQSCFDTLDDGTELELQEDQRESSAITYSDDGTFTLAFEALSDEFEVESPKEFVDECGTSTTLNTTTTNKPTNKKPAHWSRSAIYYLIGTYKRLARDEACGKTCFGSMVIWTEVSRRLQNRGFPCTPEQCRTKWTLLKKLYQHIRNESQLRRFEFVEHVHDYYKDPMIERLLADVRKRTTANRRGRRAKRNMPTSNPDSGNRIDNGRNKALENVSANDDNPTLVHIEPLNSTYCQLFIEQVNEFGSMIDHSDPEMVHPMLCNETNEATIEDVLQSEETSFDGKTPEVQTSDFIREFKQIVSAQDKRRDERHKEKLRIFREYCDRLLAQQHEAINLHKQLMERLIARL